MLRIPLADDGMFEQGNDRRVSTVFGAQSKAASDYSTALGYNSEVIEDFDICRRW